MKKLIALLTIFNLSIDLLEKILKIINHDPKKLITVPVLVIRFVLDYLHDRGDR